MTDDLEKLDNPFATADGGVFISPALDFLAAGAFDDLLPSSEQIAAIISVLSDAGICCFFVQEYALVYYGSRRLTNDRVLCIPDKCHERAVEIFNKIDILKLCGRNPLSSPGSLNHTYPRFKATGRLDFWLLVPASYCHIICEPQNVEWSMGGLPYPKLAVYTQSLLDTKNGVDLEDIIDAMDLSKEWGEENLDLNGDTDTEWLEGYIERLRGDEIEKLWIDLEATPLSRRDLWKKYVENKQRRLGWKCPSEIYATRYRRHGAKDPRTRQREGL